MYPSFLFTQLLERADNELWTLENLSRMKSSELRMIARIQQTPKGLPRERLILRLIRTREIRSLIACYATDQIGIAEMIVSFNRKQLHAMCKDMKLWRSGTKRQLAACLLSWRDRCRSEGYKQFLLIQHELALKTIPVVMF